MTGPGDMQRRPDPEIRQLLARIEAIEARQRAYRQHDPGCPVERHAHDRSGLGYRNDPVCDCWLKS